jgi:hypothetical protein
MGAIRKTVVSIGGVVVEIADSGVAAGNTALATEIC